MKELTWFERVLDKIESWYYNCNKGRHQWSYRLSESGVVYMDDKDVPKELWRCSKCGINKNK